MSTKEQMPVPKKYLIASKTAISKATGGEAPLYNEVGEARPDEHPFGRGTGVRCKSFAIMPALQYFCPTLKSIQYGKKNCIQGSFT